MPKSSENCDVCGTAFDELGPLSIESELGIYANVCSWLCVAQFGLAETIKQREKLVVEIASLETEKKTMRAFLKKKFFGFQQPESD